MNIPHSLPDAHDVALGVLLEVGLHHPGRVLPVGHDAAGGEAAAGGFQHRVGGGCGRHTAGHPPPDVRPGQAHRDLPSHTGCQLGILHKFIPGFGFGT